MHGYMNIKIAKGLFTAQNRQLYWTAGTKHIKKCVYNNHLDALLILVY
jgi:hypothetical protein